MLTASAVLLRVSWAIGVGALAFALSSGLAAAQTPTPDPAPLPPPPAPVVEPSPAPPTVVEHAPSPTQRATPKKRPKLPLALRMARLHPPLAEKALYQTPAADLPALSGVRFAGSGSSDSFHVAFMALLALGGLIGAVLIVLVAVPERLMSSTPAQLADHRGELAVGGFAVLLGLAIGVSLPLLLQ